MMRLNLQLHKKQYMLEVIMEKTKILEEFWYDNIRPFEQVAPPDPLLSEKAMTAKSALFSTLSVEQKTLLHLYESACDVVNME